MSLRTLKVGVETQLCGVTLGEEILAKDIRDQDPLVTRIKAIEIGVSVLLEHLERGEVVLPAIINVVAEEARAEVGVVEDETAEIAYERLNPKSGRHKVIVAGEIADMQLDERFLKRHEIFASGGSVLRVRINDVSFFDIDVIVIVNRE